MKRTLENEFGIYCCSKCKKAEIKDYKGSYGGYYCYFKCPNIKEKNVIRGYLDSHYCEDFVTKTTN